MPLVSVIMPAFNAAPFLGSAVESVLAQSCTELELIIIDDASSDETPDVLRTLVAKHDGRVKILRQTTRTGPAGARNAGLAASAGDYILFADADDIQHPTRVERSLAVLTQPSPPSMVFVDCQMIDAKGHSLQRSKGYPQAFCAETALLLELERNQLWTSLCAMRRLPGMRFDESLPTSEDYEFFLRLLISGHRLGLIRDALVQYRLHDHNISAGYTLANDCARIILSRLNYAELTQDLLCRHPEPDVRIAVAAALLNCERPREALDQLHCVAPPADAEHAFKWQFLAAVANHALGDLALSREHFTRAYEQNPNDAAVLNNLGVLAADLDQDFQQAAGFFRKAVDTRPGYMDAERNLRGMAQGSTDLRLTPRPLRETLVHTKERA